MANTRISQVSFARGEFCPPLYMRTDLEQYSIGLKTLKNGFVHQEGCVSNRFGLEYIGEAKYSDKKTRLIPFTFNTKQTYIIEAGEHYFRFIQDGGYIVYPDDYEEEELRGEIVELETPYEADDLQNLKIAQSADILTITHLKYAPKELIRYDHHRWTLTDIIFQPSIVAPQNIRAVWSGSTSSNTRNYTYLVTAVDKETLEESERSQEVTATGHREAYWTTSEYFTISWDAVEGASEYNVYRSVNGIFGYVGTSTTTSFTDDNIEPDLSETAPILKNPFADGNNPSCCAYYQQRKIYANTVNNPQTLYASQTATSNNFNCSRPLIASDAVEVPLADREVNEIMHLIPFKDLIALTSNSEYKINGADGKFEANPMPVAVTQSCYGASHVQPVVSGSMVLFVEAGGNVIRELGYDYLSDSYDGDELSLYASHLFEGKEIIYIAYAKAPYRLQSDINDAINYAQENGHDGVIFKNLKDEPLKLTDDSATHVVVFNNKQIKSVNNQGTFDADNPNIYYQTGNEEIDESAVYKNLPKDLKEAVDFIYQGSPVYNITGREFPNNGENFNKRVVGFYKEKFDNKISVPALGEIKLDNRSVKDSIYHGTNENKMNAFAAVPYVIQNGKMLDVTKDNGKEEKRYLFVAPVTLKDEDYYCEVVVKSNKDRQGFYIHEVELTEKLTDVFSTAHHGTPISSKSIIADLINNLKGNVKEYNPREVMEQYNKNGKWTKNKILKYLKENGSNKGIYRASDLIAEFADPEELKDHMFYHGSATGSATLRPSITFNQKMFEENNGGGYGEKYWAISVTKSKKVASRFSGMSSHVNIYPIVLAKNANVIERPDFTDSIDLEEHIVDLYNQGVDAVWIGDKNDGEQELAVINPRAIVNIGTPDIYKVFKLGSAENPLNIKSDAEIEKLYNDAIEFNKKREEIRKNYDKDKLNNLGYEYRNKIHFQFIGEKGAANLDKSGYNISSALDEATLSYSMPEGDQRSIFEGNNIARDAVNKLENVRGFVLPSEKIIVVLKNADESTIPHELAHIWLDFLEKNSESSDILKDDLAAVRKFLKNDGEPFTREQHEKFARSFEVYLRSGYAKNNKLKKIFEDLKNFLLAIYDDIKKIMYPEAGELKTFTDEEIQKIEGLFDRLLTTEKARIRTTVFDKIAEIDSKIEHIKSNEANELKELDEIWKDNIELLNRKSDKKRKVEEYLELAEKMTSRETKEMKAFKKRYKDATLDILSVATGYDKRFIANPRNLEKVQMALEKTEDRIYNAGGMMPEWEEFYSDTGVNYETDEVGGGYKLAEQAFNVLAEGRYEKTLSDNYEFEEIGKFAAKLDYLHAKVKTLRGKEKAAALEALYSLFNKMPEMPDDVTVELVKKLDDISQEYEEDEKEAFNSKAIASIPVVHQLQYYITRKLSDLKVYNPETKYKMRINKSHRLYRYIKDINSVNAAKRQVKLINEFVIDDMRNNQRSILHKEIQKQIRVNSKVVKTGTISRGKFDWKTNTVFHILEELNKKPQEEILKEYEYLTGIDSCEEDEAREEIKDQNTKTLKEAASRQDLLYREFLEYRAKKISELDVNHTIQLLQDILELKEKGRAAKSEEEFNKVFEREDLKQGLVDKLKEKLQDKKVQKYIARWVGGETVFTSEKTLANWETLLTVLFGKDVARKNSLLYLEAQTEVYAHNKTVEFLDVIRDCYNLTRKNETKKDKIKNTFDKIIDHDLTQDIVKLFNEYDAETSTWSHRTWNKDTNEVLISKIDLSHSEIMTFYGWARNDAYKERLVNAFGEEQLEEMFSLLSEQDKIFMERASEFCDTMFDATNEVFIRTTGLSLPKIQNYLPGRTERYGSDLDLFSERVVKSNNPSFIKYRKKCSKIEMKPTTPLALILPHINKTARYVVMSERVNFLNRVFCNNKHLQDALNDIYSQNDPLPDLTFGYDYVNNAVTGAKVQLKVNENIHASRLAPKEVDVQKLPFEISDKPSENRKNIIDALGLKDNEREVENGNTLESVKFNSSTVEKSMSNVKRGDLNYVDFCKIMLDAEYLFKTSQKMLSHGDIKGDTPLIIDRYANIAKVGDNEYLLEFIVKNGEEVSLYSVNPIKEMLSTKRLLDDDIHSSALDSINYSITYIQDVLKARLVEKYNRDYLKAKNEQLKEERQLKKKGVLSKIPFVKNIGKRKKETTGSKIMSVLRNQLAASTYDNYARDYQIGSNVADKVISNWVAASIGGNIKVMLTQLVSVINYSEDMPVKDWNKRFKDNLLHPKETIKYMMDNCEYLKARLAGNSQNEVIQRLANDADMFTNIKKFMTANTKFGDILAIIFGGKPYVDYLMEVKGVSKEEAFKRFVEATLRSQQSGHNSATSAWQKDAGKKNIARIVLGAFNNTNLQYERKWVEAISNYASGDITKQQFIKELMIYKVLNPIAFTSVLGNLALSAFIAGLFGGDDPKELAKVLGIDLGFAVLLSNLKGYGVAGIIALALGNLARYFIDGSTSFKTSLGPLTEIENAIYKIAQKDLTPSDWIEYIIAPALKTTGVPAPRLINVGRGVYDMSRGEIGIGLYETLGYSNYRATVGATGKAPDNR